MLCGKDENMAANYLFEVDLSGIKCHFINFFRRELITIIRNVRMK